MYNGSYWDFQSSLKNRYLYYPLRRINGNCNINKTYLWFIQHFAATFRKGDMTCVRSHLRSLFASMFVFNMPQKLLIWRKHVWWQKQGEIKEISETNTPNLKHKLSLFEQIIYFYFFSVLYHEKETFIWASSLQSSES